MTEVLRSKDSENISTKRMISFALGAPIGGLLFGMWGNIQFFAVVVLLIPQSIIAIIFLIYSIIDGFNDPILGYITDRSKKYTAKYGKRYLWILIGAIISPVLLILCFVPISSSVIGASIWLCIIMLLYESFRTLHEISHSSLFPDLFRDDAARRKVIWIRGIIGGISAILSAVSLPIILGALGGETSLMAYIGTTIIIVVIVYLLIIPYMKSVRESDEMKKFRADLDEIGKSTSPIIEIIKRVLKNRNWMAIVIANFSWAIAGACMLYGLNFFVVYNLELGIAYVAFPALAHSVIGIVFAPIWMKIAKKIGIKKTYTISLALNTVGFLFFFLVNSLITLTLVISFVGIATSANAGVIFTIATAEAIDDAAINSGKREEGSYFGILRVFSAFSYFFQTFIFAVVAGITGFDSALGLGQSDAAKFGLNFQMSIIPMFIILAGTIIFALMYKIKKEDAEANKSKLKELGL